MLYLKPFCFTFSPLNYNLTFWTYKIFSSKFEVVVGGVWHQTPPTTTPKLQLDYLDLENFIINV